MKTVFYALFLFYCIGCNAQDFKTHIRFLASDSLHGRLAGSADELKAANYIASEFKLAKCKMVFQKFPFEKDSALNVFGFYDVGSDTTIIISAHYDHLGYGTDKSHEIIKKGIHPGADDNASGVAMMVELAKWISKTAGWKYNFVFAAYSAHEAGLYGSAYFAKSNLSRSLKIRSVINLDMVGRLDPVSKTIRISGAETDSVFHAYFQDHQDSLLHFLYDDSNILLSDLKPFSEKGVPVLNITTGIHDDYHRIGDVESKINYPGMKNVFNALQGLLLKLIQK